MNREEKERCGKGVRWVHKQPYKGPLSVNRLSTFSQLLTDQWTAEINAIYARMRIHARP